VVDWEFAVSASPLEDLGRFLRYERASRPVVASHFSRGYCAAGGKLPPNWRRLARWADLIGLNENLTHDHLPGPMVLDLVGRIRAAVEECAPRLA